ncbi:MAG: hypothetical protein A2528_00990 [Candidatus Staskawiczbacteria bacterium RIFOXYD2_FULL_37_9]|uniref:Uncharacterized protein n=1 Tax=Candidatus Staskawiczbacteria bacterium RIFOXYB1_FULL_37_44 TaxID=1802223 RepID=A0A1G2IXM8_9BACT|nr:MAG: hypothetical protein A2358_00165 [Candidatus Staskawiczbacteria bacterium RIFOXYB1_FULL_37_44]OGZ83707.1 MAG: hypothetical protein A2416_03845 [Candidatus Staskawiczbacteria bacterium RIFOXYC1_FULL_37_52]OGZ90231.1 MAG: hypothetical protein A2581_02375 [Candidatus Staskawiczbacteria bacterium RIFOXYD1_FULL_37_110]OGZ93361.1 MAG: hypothetical protein A2528_00990 [Candidatus Staskawiczbacteria bacterium RIFOXYD2_FULL_37_9]
MAWGILSLVVSAPLFMLLGARLITAKSRDKSGEIIVCIAFCALFGIFGGVLLHLSGTGNITLPKTMPEQIYTVYGQVSTSSGETVAIIEDSRQNVFAVWSKFNSDEQPSLPLTAKFAKPGFVDGKCRLVPVDMSSGSVTIPNPLPTAEAPAAK